MKHQKVSVDVWTMVKTMAGYLAVVLLGGLLLRLVIAVVTLPRRFAQQRENVDRAIRDLQTRYPECFQKAMEDIKKDEENKEKSAEEKEEKSVGDLEQEVPEVTEVKGDTDKKED